MDRAHPHRHRPIRTTDPLEPEGRGPTSTRTGQLAESSAPFEATSTNPIQPELSILGEPQSSHMTSSSGSFWTKFRKTRERREERPRRRTRRARGKRTKARTTTTRRPEKRLSRARTRLELPDRPCSSGQMKKRRQDSASSSPTKEELSRSCFTRTRTSRAVSPSPDPTRGSRRTRRSSSRSESSRNVRDIRKFEIQ